MDKIPETKGIYCCFSCDDKTVNGKYQNSKPIYIGMTADSFKKRINEHKNKDHDNWKKHLPKGKQLVYAMAEFDEDILQSVEAALICKNRPTENTEYTEGYQGEYHSVTIKCTGAYRGLQSCITATFVGTAK